MPNTPGDTQPKELVVQGTPFDPVSPFAASISWLAYIILVIAAVIFVIVTGLVFYNAWRFRARPGRWRARSGVWQPAP